MLRWLFYFQRRHIAHMEREIAWLRACVQQERLYAAAALDQLLARQAQSGPIAPALLVDRGPSAVDKELRDLTSHPDFAGLGQEVP